MTSFIFYRKNVSPTEDLFVRWIYLNHRKVYLSIGVRLPVLDIYEKGSIIRIQDKDDMCLARALVVCIAKIEKDSRYKSIVDHRWPLKTRLAHDLHEKANVSIGPCCLEEVKQFQTYLSNYQIDIISKDHQNSVLYSGPEKETRIYLFLHDNHYDVITSIPAFFARKRYCHTCKKGYDKIVDHICPDSCKLCSFPNCPIVS